MKKQNRHWEDRAGLTSNIYHRTAGIGEIRVYDYSTGNSIEQSFMRSIRDRIAKRLRIYNYGSPAEAPVETWEEVEAIIDDVIETGQGFTKDIVELLTPKIAKDLALTTLKAEAQIINQLHPQSKEEVEEMLVERQAEIDKYKK